MLNDYLRALRVIHNSRNRVAPTLEEEAKIMGINITTYQRVNKGYIKNISPQNQERIAIYFGIPISNLDVVAGMGK